MGGRLWDAKKVPSTNIARTEEELSWARRQLAGGDARGHSPHPAAHPTRNIYTLISSATQPEPRPQPWPRSRSRSPYRLSW